MQIKSLKLSLDMLETADKKVIPVVSGKLLVDHGTTEVNEATGEELLDDDNEKIPKIEALNFQLWLKQNPEIKSALQSIMIEALTLHNMEVAEENGDLEHFVRQIGADEEQTKDIVKTRTKLSKDKK